MCLEEALDAFVLQLEADGRSQHTIAQYRRHVLQLGRWLAQEGHCEELDAVDHQTLARFLTSSDALTSQRGGRKRQTSLNALRTSLRCFFGYCHEAGWAPENAARLVRRARCGSAPPRGLSEDDQRRLLDTLVIAQGTPARRDHLLFHLLLATGMRLSAALGLTDRNVDLERGDLVVMGCKGDRVERVILGPGIRDHLVGYLAERGPGPLFPGRDGRPMSRRHAVRRLDHWLRRAGCQGRTPPHGLRHTFATRLYRQTRDVLLVQQALGHAAITSTMAYTRADAGRLREVLTG